MLSPTRVTLLLALLSLFTPSSLAIDPSTAAQIEQENADNLAAKDAECALKLIVADKQIEQVRKETADKLAAKDADCSEKLVVASKQMEQVRKDAADRAAKEAEVIEKLSEAEQQIERIQNEAAEKLAGKDAEATDQAARTDLQIARMEKGYEAKLIAKGADVTEKLDFAFKQIEKNHGETADKLAAKDAEADEKLAAADNQMKRIHEEYAEKLVVKDTEADHKHAQAELKMAEKDDEHRKEFADLKATHDERVREIEESAENLVLAVYDEMEKVIANLKETMSTAQEKHMEKVQEMENELAKVTRVLQNEMKREIGLAAAELTAEQGRYSKLEGELREVKAQSLNKEKIMDGDLQLLRTNSFRLEREVSSWKETHASQGYCNATLIKVDSAWHLANALDIVTDKAAALYDAHLAEHVTLVYNQHILRVYAEHVSPIVEPIKEEAVDVIEKLTEEAHKARSEAAKLVRQSSSSALGAMKEKEIDSMLPLSLVSLLVRSSTDGEWAIDMLCIWLLIITVILIRSLILQFVWGVFLMPFSLMWFFCPLRLFVGGGQKMAENNGDTKGATQAMTNKNITKKSENSKMNGKKKANGKM